MRLYMYCIYDIEILLLFQCPSLTVEYRIEILTRHVYKYLEDIGLYDYVKLLKASFQTYRADGTPSTAGPAARHLPFDDLSMPWMSYPSPLKVRALAFCNRRCICIYFRKEIEVKRWIIFPYANTTIFKIYGLI